MQTRLVPDGCLETILVVVFRLHPPHVVVVLVVDIIRRIVIAVKVSSCSRTV